jgi:hypothetical protein
MLGFMYATGQGTACGHTDSIINESMKELLTKKFWRDVKKTFDEAREESPNSGDSPAASPAGAKSKGSEVSEVPLPPEATQPKN